MSIHRHRFRLIDQLRAGTKISNENGTSTAVAIARVMQIRENSWVKWLQQHPTQDERPICAQMLYEFSDEIYPPIGTQSQLGCQNRVFEHQCCCRFTLTEGLHKSLISLLRCVSFKNSLQARNI